MQIKYDFYHRINSNSSSIDDDDKIHMAYK